MGRYVSIAVAGRKRQEATYRRRWGVDKYIQYTDEILDINDSHVPLVDPSAKAQKVVRDAAIAAAIEAGGTRKDAVWERAMIEEPTFEQIISAFVNGIPYGDPPAEGEQPLRAAPEDQGTAIHVVRAFRGHVNGHVKIEEKALIWLRELVSDHGNREFTGTLPALILERLNDELTPEEIVAVRVAEKTEEPVAAGTGVGPR